MGSYRYLMIYTAIFEIYYSLFDLISGVRVYSYGLSVGLYRIREPWMPKKMSIMIAITYGSTFGSTMAVLASHFIYRYGATNNFTFKGCNFYILFALPFIYATWWAIAAVSTCLPTEESDEYLETFSRESLGCDISDFSYATVQYFTISNGTLNFYWKGWAVMGNCSVIVSSSMFCVMYLGIKCYSNISEQLAKTSGSSQFSANLQKQLFNALVIQTILPTVLLFIPVTAFFLLPLFNIDVGDSSNIISDLIGLYPTLDPLPNMFIIHSYRQAVIDILTCFHKPSIAPAHSLTNARVSDGSIL